MTTRLNESLLRNDRISHLCLSIHLISFDYLLLYIGILISNLIFIFVNSVVDF